VCTWQQAESYWGINAVLVLVICCGAAAQKVCKSMCALALLRNRFLLQQRWLTHKMTLSLTQGPVTSANKFTVDYGGTSLVAELVPFSVSFQQVERRPPSGWADSYGANMMMIMFVVQISYSRLPTGAWYNLGAWCAGAHATQTTWPIDSDCADVNGRYFYVFLLDVPVDCVMDIDLCRHKDSNVMWSHRSLKTQNWVWLTSMGTKFSTWSITISDTQDIQHF
jgi:hypothetical protein